MDRDAGIKKKISSISPLYASNSIRCTSTKLYRGYFNTYFNAKAKIVFREMAKIRPVREQHFPAILARSVIVYLGILQPS